MIHIFFFLLLFEGSIISLFFNLDANSYEISKENFVKAIRLKEIRGSEKKVFQFLQLLKAIYWLFEKIVMRSASKKVDLMLKKMKEGGHKAYKVSRKTKTGSFIEKSYSKSFWTYCKCFFHPKESLLPLY